MIRIGETQVQSRFDIGDEVRPTQETLNDETTQMFYGGLLSDEPQEIVQIRYNSEQEIVHSDTSLTLYTLANGAAFHEYELEEV